MIWNRPIEAIYHELKVKYGKLGISKQLAVLAIQVEMPPALLVKIYLIGLAVEIAFFQAVFMSLVNPV